MPRTTYPSTQEFLDLSTLRLARCWEIVLIDGQTTIRITDHNRRLVVFGQTYEPNEGPTGTEGMIAEASAERRSLGDTDHSRDIRATLTSGAIRISDMREGAYENAQVTEYLVDWRYPFAGPMVTTTFWIEDVDYDGEQWRASLRTISRVLNRNFGDLATRQCPYELGDSQCRVVISNPQFSRTATVDWVDTPTRIRVKSSTLAGTPLNAYQFGRAGFTAPTALLGKMPQIDGNTAYYVVLQTIVLFFADPVDPIPTVGTNVNLIVGCDGTVRACQDKFNNLVNFGGYPWLTGPDLLLVNPSQA